VFNTTNTSYGALNFKWTVYGRSVLNKKGDFYAYELYTYEISIPAFSPSDPICKKLDVLNERC